LANCRGNDRNRQTRQPAKEPSASSSAEETRRFFHEYAHDHRMDAVPHRRRCERAAAAGTCRAGASPADRRFPATEILPARRRQHETQKEG